jgi:hypothetical protein
MKKNLKTLRSSLFIAAFAGVTALTASDADPFLGRWALTIPGGGAGWLGVTQENGYYDASILWGGGSVVPVSSVFFTEGQMWVMRVREVRRKDAAGKVVRTQQFTEAIIARLDGEELRLTQINPRENGEGMSTEEFSGKRIPDMPAKPDLAKVKFGAPITLFDGNTLAGWRLTDAGAVNGWSVKDGILINNPFQEDGKPHKNYGNLRTEKEVEDFNLKLEVKVEKDNNSGIYLRGIYEVQVADTYGRGLDSHNMGGIYSRITPTENAEKAPGEWQTMDLTLVDRHATVILNGKKIIDNEPLLGCTGGALWSDEFKPGPIYLQGDHTGIKYRNIILAPVVK